MCVCLLLFFELGVGMVDTRGATLYGQPYVSLFLLFFIFGGGERVLFWVVLGVLIFFCFFFLF